MGDIIGVEAGVEVIVVATLTLPGITRTILVTTAVTATTLTVPLRTIMDPIHTTMVTRRLHQPSIR